MRFNWCKIVAATALIIASYPALASDAPADGDRAQFKATEQSIAADLNRLLQQQSEASGAAVLQFASKHRLDCAKDGLDIYHQCGFYTGDSYPYIWLFVNDNAQVIAYMGSVLDSLSKENMSDCRGILSDEIDVCFTPLMTESERLKFIERYKSYLSAAG